jgi:UDP-N-acetylenolpyruvoylglucosamine reductase
MYVSEDQINLLCKSFPKENIIRQDNWSNLTTIGIGTGKCIVIVPSSKEKLVKILRYTFQNKIPVLPIGAGSNTIGTDLDNTTVLIKLTNPVFKKVTIDGVTAIGGAGISLLSFIKHCAEHNLGGMSQLSGIPGTLAGSLRTNAGRLGICIFDVIEKLKGYKFDGTPWECSSKNIEWSYRYSKIPFDVIVTDIVFNLKEEDKSITTENVDKFIRERSSKYPKGRNAGCIFKNPASGNGTGKLIDLSDCKGATLSNLEVSDMHANFIVNNGISKEENFVSLVTKVREKVYNFSGIYLSPEVFFVNKISYNHIINNPSPLKIAVLKGGDCRERPVSLESALNVSNALREAGYIVKEFDIKTPELPDEAKQCDVVFPVLHGGFGEDGRIQKVMEKIGIPFVGCGSKASSIAIDKIKNKKLFEKIGIPTPKSAVIYETETQFPETMSLPIVVKPPQEGSTFGITIVHKMCEWLPALKKAAIDPTRKILVEEYIDNLELTAGVLNGNALPLVHICYPGEMYDYDAKYTHNTGETLYISPPDSNLIPKEVQIYIQKNAVRIYNEIKAKHLLRIDILLDKKNMTPYFLEINNLPGFTASSLFPKAAAAIDIPYIQVCATLVRLAFKDNN